jgi:hypothetical protein
VPNGNSGGFQLATAEFRALLDTFSDDDAIGGALRDDPEAPGRTVHPSKSGISKREVVALLDRHTSDNIYVEEQDGAFYIVHLDVPKAEVYRDFRLHSAWVLINPDSPLYTSIRSRYRG